MSVTTSKFSKYFGPRHHARQQSQRYYKQDINNKKRSLVLRVYKLTGNMRRNTSKYNAECFE